MKQHLLVREQFLARPREAVFAFFAKPENLGMITPPALGFKILTPPPLEMRAGALYDYYVYVRGIPFRWSTYISDYDPPHRFVDVQLRGPYAYWHHTHTFEERDGGTLIRDEVRYILPFGQIGSLVHALLVRRDIERIFTYRESAITRLLAANERRP